MAFLGAPSAPGVSIRCLFRESLCTIDYMRVASDRLEEGLVGLRFVHRLAPEQSAPLVVLVHGRAGDAQVMWTFDRLIPAGSTVVSFEGFLSDTKGGFSWWDVNETDSLEAGILRARDRLALALARYIDSKNLSPRRIVALGFSQGAVLLSAALLSGSIKLDGLAILAGVVSGAGEQGGKVEATEVFISHGTLDEIVPVESARKGAERLRAKGLRVVYLEEAVGHKVGVEGMRALREWLKRVLEG